MNRDQRIRRLYYRLRRSIRRGEDTVTYGVTRFALWLTQTVSLDRALRLADYFATVSYYVLPRARRLALEHIEIAFGDQLSASARGHMARAAFCNYARCYVELAKLEEIRLQEDDYVSIDGWEHVEEVRALGRGGIVITGHIGNWELLGACVARKGGFPVAATARDVNNPRINQLLMDFRANNGVRTIMRKTRTSSWEILKVLKERGVLALSIDRDIRVPSISVPFFGRLARTPIAPAFLAVRRDLPVIPAFAQRRPEGGHHFTIMAPIYPPNSGDRYRDILELTHRFNQIIESRIRQNPTEWMWWHRRWRRPPIPRLDIDRIGMTPSTGFTRGDSPHARDDALG